MKPLFPLPYDVELGRQSRRMRWAFMSLNGERKVQELVFA